MTTETLRIWGAVSDVFAAGSRWASAYTFQCPECRCRWRRGHGTDDRDKTRLAMHLANACPSREGATR